MNRTLISIGLLLVAIGLGWPWLSQIPFWRLPGDIIIQRPRTTWYMPITTMLLVSAVLSFILWLLKR